MALWAWQVLVIEAHLDKCSVEWSGERDVAVKPRACRLPGSCSALKGGTGSMQHTLRVPHPLPTRVAAAASRLFLMFLPHRHAVLLWQARLRVWALGEALRCTSRWDTPQGCCQHGRARTSPAPVVQHASSTCVAAANRLFV
jgi:hypothetical protein